MLYTILCYNAEDVVCAWTKQEEDAVMAKLAVVQEKLSKQGRLGPVARLLPTTTATTLRKGGETMLLDDSLDHTQPTPDVSIQRPDETAVEHQRDQEYDP